MSHHHARHTSGGGGEKQQPVRPPRVTRSISKESSTGLLMSVIRSLTASRDMNERDREKANLQREFSESDGRLDQLVLAHHQDLTAVMSAFSKITSRLNIAHERLSSVRERLTACQQLLHCRREELKRLWLESVENKHILELLDQIESLSKIPEEVSNYINTKRYLNATRLLMASVSKLEGPLENVDGLSEVKTDLSSKKDEMFNLLMDDLHKHIYVKSTNEILHRIKRQASDRYKNNNNTGLMIQDNMNSNSVVVSPARKLSASEYLKRAKSPIFDEPIEEDLDPDVDPEEDSGKFISIIIECLFILNRIPEALEMIKDRADKELGNIVKRTGRELLGTHATHAATSGVTGINRNIMTTGHQQQQQSSSLNAILPAVLRSSIILSDPENKAHLLQDLFQYLFTQFRTVVSIHEAIVLVNFRRIQKRISPESGVGDRIKLYQMEDIWAKIQAVVELVADFCLDISGTSGGGPNVTPGSNAIMTGSGVMSQTSSHSDGSSHVMFGSTVGTSVADLNSYFVKKRGVGLSTVASSVSGFGVGKFSSSGSSSVSASGALTSSTGSSSSASGSSSKMSKSLSTALFRFDHSSHAMSLNQYLQEQKDAMREKAELTGESTLDSIDISETDRYIVCTPAPENLVIMFNPLIKFISEIDSELNLGEGNHCPLHSYIMRSADVFLKQINHDLDRMMIESNKSLEKRITVTDYPAVNDPLTTSGIMTQSGLSSSSTVTSVTKDPSIKSVPILQSTVMIERCIQDLKKLMIYIPPFADDFLTLILNVLSNYKDTCQSVYRSLIQPDGHHHHQVSLSESSHHHHHHSTDKRRIISASWAKDDDISRLLKSLPNWLILDKVKKNPQILAKSSLAVMSGSSLSFDTEFPEEVRLRNMKESEILTSNLSSDTLIPSHEILSDVNLLKILGLLQESLEWLGLRIQELERTLPKVTSSSNDQLLSVSTSSNMTTSSLSDMKMSSLSEVSIATLNQLSRDFEDLAETCLLVLHLEVRVHCFYYLLPLSIPSSSSSSSGVSNFAPLVDNQEADLDVIKLTKDMSAINDALGNNLQSWKLRYIFEGVGHLVSTILINSASGIKKINENGVKKMCRNIFNIQQNLTCITMSREVALDTARNYYELFLMTPEEILSSLVEKGPSFSSVEYVNAINLLCRSMVQVSGQPPKDQSYLNGLLKKLSEILNEVSVTL